MQSMKISLPGYRVADYLLVLNPHEDLRSRITEIRKEFSAKYKIPFVPNKPNLLLASFTNYEMMEGRIINKLKLVALSYPPFKVEMKNFGGFPSHTIYINVVTKVGIQNLVKTIRRECQRLMKFNDENKPYFSSEPHITVAGKLQPWQFEKASLEYSNKHFTGRFIADSMLLLKKGINDAHWQISEQFNFQNMPVLTTQGDLFS